MLVRPRQVDRSCALKSEAFQEFGVFLTNIAEEKHIAKPSPPGPTIRNLLQYAS